MRRTVVILVAAILLAGTSRPARAFDDNTFEAVAADIVVVRPFSFVATVLGSALFLVSLPVTAISKSTPQAAEALVLRPGRMTFTRPVGELSSLAD